jgi:3-hydroxybutyrate dehydrogenase
LHIYHHWKDTKITCNAICPGFVITPLLQQQIDVSAIPLAIIHIYPQARAKAKNISIEEASQDLVGEKQPTKRFTTSEQIGDMVAFLCR